MDEKKRDNSVPGLDEFSIENGFMIDDGACENTAGAKKSHSRGKSALSTAIWIISIIVVSVGIAFGAIYAGADYLGIGFGRGGNKEMEIDKGSGTAQIAQRLNDVGVVKIPVLFRAYCKLKHYDGKFKYGVYTFDSELGYDSIAQMLMTEGAKAESVKVTIKEGSTVDEIAELLEKSKVCTKSDFIDAVQNGDFDYDFIKGIPVESVHYRLEGYLFADTYNFYNYDSAKCAFLAVDKMLGNLDKKLKSANIDINNLTVNLKPYTFHEILTMSSIVELEAGGNKTEMPKVAAVFFNRLQSDDFATLGSSPTRKYPYGNGMYNTYECSGLPVGPLCSTGIETIKATLSPQQNFEYFYFVTDAKMKFYYNKTIAQHNATIAKLQAEKNWIYED